MSNAIIGKQFENYFKKRLERGGWNVLRIPDGCMHVGPGNVIRKKTPFDYVVSKKSTVVFCDVKTCQDSTFPYSKINRDQLRELLILENNGFMAGYFINFRSEQATCFVSASRLSQIMPRESIKHSEHVDLGKKIDLDRIGV